MPLAFHTNKIIFVFLYSNLSCLHVCVCVLSTELLNRSYWITQQNKQEALTVIKNVNSA